MSNRSSRRLLSRTSCISFGKMWMAVPCQIESEGSVTDTAAEPHDE